MRAASGSTSYQQRRGEVETYFDRTAMAAWARLTSTVPVSGIRATVRAGRDEMRATLLSWLPADMTGMRLLDAGCGTGALALAAAGRGAAVVAVDLSPQLVALAAERALAHPAAASITFRAGDMLDPAYGRFDYIVLMDSVIHYRQSDAIAALQSLQARAGKAVLFTFAPRTVLLSAMHSFGKLFPRGDRAPAIEPQSEMRLRAAFNIGRSQRVSSGFYISQAMEMVTMIQPSSMWKRAGTAFLPFAEATEELPLPRLARMALFQLSVGLTLALIVGTLNRVMIVELHVPAWVVSCMIALPLLFAPARAVIGFKSDRHQSAFGWKRLPYLWFGTLLQWGGLGIMPFALIVLSGHSRAPDAVGAVAAGLAFLLVGAGMHTVQTAGLALATDIVPEPARPRVVGMLCVMLLLGICIGALGYGALLRHFSLLRLVQVVQGSAVMVLFINGFGMWKQEPRRASTLTTALTAQPTLRQALAAFGAGEKSIRRLVTIGIGTASLSMQDILLEPYGGQVLHLSVSQTTALTAALAGGGLTGLVFSARRLTGGADPYRIAAAGLLIGLFAFIAVIGSAPLGVPALFAGGVFLIGMASGLFLAGTLADAMGRAASGMSGLALGAWGSVQALAAGSAIAVGGIVRDFIGFCSGNATAGYEAVYTFEIFLIFVTLAALGPLVSRRMVPKSTPHHFLKT